MGCVDPFSSNSRASEHYNRLYRKCANGTVMVLRAVNRFRWTWIRNHIMRRIEQMRCVTWCLYRKRTKFTFLIETIHFFKWQDFILHNNIHEHLMSILIITPLWGTAFQQIRSITENSDWQMERFECTSVCGVRYHLLKCYGMTILGSTELDWRETRRSMITNWQNLQMLMPRNFMLKIICIADARRRAMAHRVIDRQCELLGVRTKEFRDVNV